jgi:hypothetical protein
VDEGSQLIVAAALSNISSDCPSLIPMIDQTECNTGMSPQMTLADTGYASEAGLRELEVRALPACVALGREHKQQRTVNAARHPATARMARTLRTPEGRAHYRRRKAIPEPVFGIASPPTTFGALTSVLATIHDSLRSFSEDPTSFLSEYPH